ncbi:DUF922 domain-containing protein [Undibacterium sp. Di27W]|uniref:DUF922 domain-containing protein n=1 Tax=Undibacterium sp. Di27W TaxID=3413036 RepID=UPI003BF06B11
MEINKLILLSLLSLSGLAQAEVIETVNYVTYTVKPEAGTSLSRAMITASPITEGDKKYRGHTQWDMHWNYTYDKASDLRTCKVKTVSVSLKATITLPELSSKDDKLIAQFKQYLPALKKHELGHLQIAREAAKKIERSLLAQPALASCELLKTALNANGRALTEEAKILNVQYDAQTRHGQTQGAFLPD